MKEISTHELKKMIDNHKDFTLLDCRGVDYFLWEHLPSAVNLRWKYVEERTAGIIPDKNTFIVTSCDGFTCMASIKAFQRLEKLGYTNLHEYAGGLADWKANGLPTIKDPNHKIADNVYRFPNQKFYTEAVGSYLIEEDDFILLIDGPQQLTEEHEDFLESFGKPIRVFLSHESTGGDGKVLQEKFGAKIYLHKADKNGNWLKVKPDVLIEDGFEFDKNLKVIHVPGHTPGSSVLFDQKNKIMFAGDHIDGTSRGEIRDFIDNNDGQEGDIKQRFESTKTLLSYDFEKILPFHAEMILENAKEKLQTFITKHGK